MSFEELKNHLYDLFTMTLERIQLLYVNPGTFSMRCRSITMLRDFDVLFGTLLLVLSTFFCNCLHIWDIIRKHKEIFYLRYIQHCFRVTDGQMDGQTDGIAVASTALAMACNASIAARCKKKFSYS